MAMHTMIRQSESEWSVGRIEHYPHGDTFVVMFSGLRCISAVRLVSALNGGECPIGDISAEVLPMLWGSK